MVLDTHTHAWGYPTPDHPWTNGPLIEDLTSGFSTDIGYTADKLLTDMDEAGIDEAVVVGYPITDWTDNWYTEKAAAEHERLYAVSMIDVFDDGADETLRDLMATDRMLGFRLGAICPYDEMWERFDYDQTWLRDAIGETAFWEAAGDTDALVQLMAHTSQFDQVHELVERYSDLAYAFDHFAHANADDDPADSFEPLEPLAAYDRVAVKISEVAYVSDEAFPYEDTWDHVRWLLDTFGRERVVWGSDFPNVSHPEFGGMTYEATLKWLEEVPFVSKRDRTWLTDRAFRDLANL